MTNVHGLFTSNIVAKGIDWKESIERIGGATQLSKSVERIDGTNRWSELLERITGANQRSRWATQWSGWATRWSNLKDSIRWLSIGFLLFNQCFTLDNTSVVKGEDVWIRLKGKIMVKEVLRIVAVLTCRCSYHNLFTLDICACAWYQHSIIGSHTHWCWWIEISALSWRH